jgi:hypothetical protein
MLATMPRKRIATPPQLGTPQRRSYILTDVIRHALAIRGAVMGVTDVSKVLQAILEKDLADEIAQVQAARAKAAKADATRRPLS